MEIKNKEFETWLNNNMELNGEDLEDLYGRATYTINELIFHTETYLTHMKRQKDILEYQKQRKRLDLKYSTEYQAYKTIKEKEEHAKMATYEITEQIIETDTLINYLTTLLHYLNNILIYRRTDQED